MSRDIIEGTEKAIELERKLWADLITNDDGTPALFEDLSRRTAKVLTVVNFFLPRWNADSTFTPSSIPEFYKLPPDLEAGWREYAVRWERFLDLNPRARIANMLSEVSESHDASSFPYSWEHMIRDWMTGGFPDPHPFQDSNRIDTPSWRQRLAAASAAAGPGWVFYVDEQYRWLQKEPL